MPIDLQQLVREIVPAKTVLLFGAGSSIPSNAPSVKLIKSHFAKRFEVAEDKYSLREQSSIAETRSSRRSLITALRELFHNLRPTGGLLNLPLYDWKSLFTTNYDSLIEQSYKQAGRDIGVFSSNFDFTIHELPAQVKLFKLHGTIEKDVSDGHTARIILTDQDYDQTDDYREMLFDRLKSDLSGAHLIIGHSLADPDIKEIVNRAVQLNAKSGGSGRISLLLFDRDPDRAQLFEQRGIEVCFAGINEFFGELSKSSTLSPIACGDSENVLSKFPGLVPITIDVEHAISSDQSDVSAMFSGWPANFADVSSGLTFQRNVSADVDIFLNEPAKFIAVIVGASGVGKTTAARQVLVRFRDQGKLVWEHITDQPLSVQLWTGVMHELHAKEKVGVLFIDDAHTHLQQINDLIDTAASDNIGNLLLVLASTRNHWYPRIKTPNIYRYGREWHLSQLQTDEVERLLQLVDSNEKIRPLVEPMFSGFSKYERRRRLSDRCGKDFFVCLKNIFATDNLDDIILREYAELAGPVQDIYRYVAALESAGVRVHRQLIVRLLAIPAASISAVLGSLKDIVHEYDIEVREGIFAWRCRHSVIAAIITKYKFNDSARLVELFERVIDSIRPTYDIEIRTIRDLCNVESGLPRIQDKETQNRLLRRLMSVAPGERIPRHRLIRNLIEMEAFEKAEAEIRIFTNDFGSDGPVHRYRINLLVARATKAPGLLAEDRVAILEQAKELAVSGAHRYPNNKNILSAYAELGIEYYKLTKKADYFEDALRALRIAEDRNGDPEIGRTILRYERRIAGHHLDSTLEN